MLLWARECVLMRVESRCELLIIQIQDNILANYSARRMVGRVGSLEGSNMGKRIAL